MIQVSYAPVSIATHGTGISNSICSAFRGMTAQSVRRVSPPACSVRPPLLRLMLNMAWATDAMTSGRPSEGRAGVARGRGGGGGVCGYEPQADRSDEGAQSQAARPCLHFEGGNQDIWTTTFVCNDSTSNISDSVVLSQALLAARIICGPPGAMHGVGIWPGQQLHGTPLCSRTPFGRPAAHRRRFAVFAADDPQQTSTEEQPAAVRRRKKQQKQDANAEFNLGDVNPISIGRKTRQVCARRLLIAITSLA